QAWMPMRRSYQYRRPDSRKGSQVRRLFCEQSLIGNLLKRVPAHRLSASGEDWGAVALRAAAVRGVGTAAHHPVARRSSSRPTEARPP
ncbi:MAG: hypothetical protein AB1725_07955, partial [Armatimonadota bacterium]